MLGNCQGLSDCEKVLQNLIPSISLIGEIPLAEEDINKLVQLIREKIETNIEEGKWELEIIYPACLACFLVWKGHDEYKGGDFWSSVWESLNLSKNSNLQGE